LFLLSCEIHKESNKPFYFKPYGPLRPILGLLSLIKSAIRKAKRKADEMMAEIGHSIIGVRPCSDSYQAPNIGEIIIGGPGASRFDDTMESARGRVGSAMPAVDFGAQFKSKKRISATCTIEFLVQETHQTYPAG